jgi:hypothetical protein
MELIGKGNGRKGALRVALRVPDGHLSARARIRRFPLADPENALYEDVHIRAHDARVHSHVMRNVTFSVDAQLLERGRDVARRRSTTLNEMFREWLAQVASEKREKERYTRLMRRLSRVRSGGRFTRDEMNAR